MVEVLGLKNRCPEIGWYTPYQSLVFYIAAPFYLQHISGSGPIRPKRKMRWAE
jgi:hypothetical protein